MKRNNSCTNYKESNLSKWQNNHGNHGNHDNHGVWYASNQAKAYSRGGKVLVSHLICHDELSNRLNSIWFRPFLLSWQPAEKSDTTIALWSEIGCQQCTMVWHWSEIAHGGPKSGDNSARWSEIGCQRCTMVQNLGPIAHDGPKSVADSARLSEIGCRQRTMVLNLGPTARQDGKYGAFSP